MRFSPETDPHYWDHKVFTVGELYDAMEERDRLKGQLAEGDLSRYERDKMKKELGKLKTKRKALNLSMRTVASKMKMSKSAFERLESGERLLTPQLLEKYRGVFKSHAD